MRTSIIKALEMKALWQQWANTRGDYIFENAGYKSCFPLYQICLDQADSLFMNKNFCDLVDHARKTVPDDLVFEESWLPCKQGFLWLDTPFSCPDPESVVKDSDLTSYKGKIKVSAVGWLTTSDGIQFLNFLDFGAMSKRSIGFGCWSYFVLRDGDKLLERTLKFENVAAEKPDKGGYGPGRATELGHEMRWIYTALHLMSQQLTHYSSQPPSSLVKQMAVRKKLKLPQFVKVISLRRMEEERPKSSVHKDVDWNWQWVVRGHWRKQPYKDGVIKNIFIEAYVKGPTDKPLKPPTFTIFNVRR